MARVHPWNMNSQFPDHGTNFDHVSEQLRSQGFEKRTSDAANPRGGGGGRGRGRGRGEHVRCCYNCGHPGHFQRECPDLGSSSRFSDRRGNQAFGNDSLKSDFTESNSATYRPKPTKTSIKYTKNSEQLKPPFDKPSKNDDIVALLARIADKEHELKLCVDENVGLCNMLRKANAEVIAAKKKNEELVLNMNKLKDDLEKCKKELLSSKEKETEISVMYMNMKSMFEDLEQANKAADVDMKIMKLETEQWRKAAKSVASVLDGSSEISSKTQELESLVLYYNNRAIKRMPLGKMRKALDDCRIAARLDPGFLRVCLTAGNCHLKLGELDDAMSNYKKCLESGAVCLDRRLTIEASEGLHKAEKVVSYIKQSAELLKEKTAESANNALEIIRKGLSISCYSEKLLEMTVEAHFLLQKYDEVVKLCEQTFPFAENNFSSKEGQKGQLKLWRWRMMARSYFRLGSFDLALVNLEKYEQLAPSDTKIEDSSYFSVAIVSELLRCKSDGNEAYKAGKYREAVKHYSNALQLSIESRSFAAICLCNRAVAHQALGEIVDAIADCNLAIALDGNYLKAISRRANLHEKIRDYEHATIDLQRLIFLLQKNSKEKSEDLKVARRCLSSIDQNLKKGMTLDLYLILGLKGSESGAEIKKAYHKAALRHHPDKAGKFLTRCESGSNGDVWKEISETIHKDADKLFKIIGEAYAVLSDPNKRLKYNLEDAMKDDYTL